jgi:acyl carrier protein
MTQISVSEIEGVVVAAIRRLAPEAPGEISLDDTTEELGMDSMTLMDLVLELEDIFRVTFPDDVLVRIRAVRDVLEIAREQVGPDRS